MRSDYKRPWQRSEEDFNQVEMQKWLAKPRPPTNTDEYG
jgi:hypothetical protein